MSHKPSPSPQLPLPQEPNADQLTLKVIYLSAGAIAVCLFISWLAPKVSVFHTLIHWMGGH